MARTRYATDRGLIARMGVTMFLIGLVFVAFIAALVYLLGAFSNISTGGIVFLAVAAALAVSLGSYFWSDKIALSTSGARLVTPQDGPQAAELHGDHRPAVRARRHAQAAGGDRADRHAQRVRHRPQQQGRGGLRHRGPAAPARARGSSRACWRTRCRTWRTRTSR